MIGEIEVVPSPTGDADRRFAYVEAAIAVLAASGLTYEVGPLGTSVEGDPDAVWTALRSAHEATLAAGADSVVTVIKVFESVAPCPTMAELVEPFRAR